MWSVEWDDRARKEFRKLDSATQKEILTYLRKRIATKEDPRRFGKPLSYDKHFWLRRFNHLNKILVSHYATASKVIDAYE